MFLGWDSNPRPLHLESVLESVLPTGYTALTHIGVWVKPLVIFVIPINANLLSFMFVLCKSTAGENMVFHLIFEGVTRVENTYKEIQPMDKDAEYVFISLHFDFYNELDENVMDGR